MVCIGSVLTDRYGMNGWYELQRSLFVSYALEILWLVW